MFTVTLNNEQSNQSNISWKHRDDINGVFYDYSVGELWTEDEERNQPRHMRARFVGKVLDNSLVQILV